jgi:adenine-specific DNA-methyltransferase
MTALPHFDNRVVDAPPTEGIKYAGSKLKLLPHILGLARQTDAKTVLDGFAGSTRVSQAFAKAGYRVISNDVAVWSEVFGTCYLLNRTSRKHYSELIRHLNDVPPKDGWFTERYGGDPDKDVHADPKKPWQIRNTRKLDGIREEIDRLRLSTVERAVALTSLILALDRVDSTLGHFVSYLKKWSPRSFRELQLDVPKVFANAEDHEVHRKDVFNVAACPADLAYFDPPYGSNNEKMPPSRVRYASYYHLWTTICLNDAPEVFGKASRRCDSSDPIAASVFEEFRRNPDTGRFLAVEAIERLLLSTAARWIILSYSSGGRATADELNAALSKAGDVREVLELDYKRNVMANMKWTNQWLPDTESPNREFLFLIDKG